MYPFRGSAVHGTGGGGGGGADGVGVGVGVREDVETTDDDETTELYAVENVVNVELLE